MNEFEQEQAECRKLLSKVRSEDLLNFYRETHRLLVYRAMVVKLGLCDASQEQQYRLTAFAIEQELLKRLHVS